MSVVIINLPGDDTPRLSQLREKLKDAHASCYIIKGNEIEIVLSDEKLKVPDAEVSELRCTVGNYLWLDNLTDEQWQTIKRDILPVLLREDERRCQ